MQSMRDQFQIMALILWIFLFTPGGAQSAPQGDVDTLRQQATVFWEARLKDDWDTLYTFLPEAQKGSLPLEQFRTHMKANNLVRHLSYELKDAATDGTLGWIWVNKASRLLRYPDMPASRAEGWQIWRKGEQGRWIPLVGEEEASAPKLPPHLRPLEEEAGLSQRAHMLWEAREKQDLGFIYDLCEPKIQEMVSREEFAQKQSLYTYLSHRVDWAEVSGDEGRVSITLTYRYNDPNLTKLDPFQETIVEEWVKVDGQWYHRVEEPAE